MRPSSRTPARSLAPITVALVALLLLPGGRAASPPLPVGDGGRLLSNLTAPVVAPGAGGAIDFTVSNPLNVSLASAWVTVELYAFNAYPGNATGTPTTGAFDLVPPAAAGSFAGNASESEWSLGLGALPVGGARPVSIEFVTSSSAPAGDYVVRFSVNATSAAGARLLFESRGFFSAATWASATTLPGGGSTLNLTRLGVSGVVPETAVLVRSNPYPVWLYGLLGGSLVLAALGGYYAVRKGPGSKSGARGPSDRSNAPRAAGNSRTSDGD